MVVTQTFNGKFLPSLAMSLNTPPADIEIYLSPDKKHL